MRRGDQPAGPAGEGDPVFLSQSSLWLPSEELTAGGHSASRETGRQGGRGERWELTIAWACHWEVAGKSRGGGWLGVWPLAPSGPVCGISGGRGGQESGSP